MGFNLVDFHQCVFKFKQLKESKFRFLEYAGEKNAVGNWEKYFVDYAKELDYARKFFFCEHITDDTEFTFEDLISQCKLNSVLVFELGKYIKNNEKCVFGVYSKASHGLTYRLTDLFYHENGVVYECKQFNKYVENKRPWKIQDMNKE